jgi:hypothetical protein
MAPAPPCTTIAHFRVQATTVAEGWDMIRLEKQTKQMAG